MLLAELSGRLCDSFPRLALVAAIVMAAVNLAGSATGALAARLEGFGPIRFGMTPDEAWRAVGEKGQRDNARIVLLYEVPIGFEDKKLQIEQRFVDGRADKGQAQIEAGGLGRCLALGWTLARQFEGWYGVEPMVRPGTVSDLIGGERFEPAAKFTDLFVFSFEGGAYVEMRLGVYGSLSQRQCDIYVRFRPPTGNELPF